MFGSSMGTPDWQGWQHIKTVLVLKYRIACSSRGAGAYSGMVAYEEAPLATQGWQRKR